MHMSRAISTLTPDSLSYGLSVVALESLPVSELQSILSDLKKEIHHIRLESEIFENFLISNEPTLIVDMDTILEKIQKAHLEAGVSYFPPTEVESESRSSSVVPRLSQIAKGPRINLNQKMDLVLREIEDVQTYHEKFIKKSKKIKFILRAETEELETRKQEIEESNKAFENAITSSVSTTTITIKIPAEKFVRYMQEWLKAAVTTLEKLRLHTIYAKVQLGKLRVQYAGKLELGESVDEVDLERMQIQKIHLLSEVRQKNINLIELKHMNAKANLMVVNHRKILEKQVQEMKSLSIVEEAKKKAIHDLEIEVHRTEKEVEKEKLKLEELKKLSRRYIVPPVMNYIKTKAELRALRQERKVWIRRISVQDIGLKTYTRMMSQMIGVLKPSRSWYTYEYISGTDDRIIAQDDNDSTCTDETNVQVFGY